MKRWYLVCFVLLVFPFSSHSWGFFGHKSINRLAVFTLPTELMVFFKQHIAFISEHAVDPDMRRYVLDEEAPRHYIDIDHYGDSPFECVPRRWDSAVAVYSEDTLMAYGIVPWHVNRMYYRLVEAFRRKDAVLVLKTASDLGHYIADAHVPLHTTENYNGQLTDQHGIHGFWESRLPELYAVDYDFVVGRATYVDAPLAFIWKVVEESHAAVDSVLFLERSLSQSFPADQKYAYDQRGNSVVNTYSRGFSSTYHSMLDGMVERRMRKSIHAIGSFWYSAWVDAGQPDMSTPIDPVVLEEIESERQRMLAKKTQNAIFGRAHE
ncbi:MAG: zinc dependent phospholipase C family protein [Cryomorphaceae bacterium]